MGKQNKHGYIGTVKLGPKGQIVIPKEVRDMFDIGPGDSLLLMAEPKRGIGLQKPNVMFKIAEKILGGQGKSMFPGEKEEDMEEFANILQEVEEEEP